MLASMIQCCFPHAPTAVDWYLDQWLSYVADVCAGNRWHAYVAGILQGDLLLFYTPLGFGRLGEGWDRSSYLQVLPW